MAPPSADLLLSSVSAPASQLCMKMAATLAPGFTRVTLRTHLDHLAGAVGERNQREFHVAAIPAARHHQVAVIQGIRPNPHQRLPGPGFGSGRSASLSASSEKRSSKTNARMTCFATWSVRCSRTMLRAR